MFTIEQIKAAHSKVKSGADFPAYIRDLKEIGVTSYETFVTDGHSDYYGTDNFKTTSPTKYNQLAVAAVCSADKFKHDLKEHQQGKTDYQTFIEMCAAFGINKWTVSLSQMTCTYFDRAGNEILQEIIPG